MHYENANFKEKRFDSCSPIFEGSTYITNAQSTKYLIVLLLNYVDTVPNVPKFQLFAQNFTKNVKNWRTVVFLDNFRSFKGIFPTMNYICPK